MSCLQVTAFSPSVSPMWISSSCRRSAANPARGTSSLWMTLTLSTPSKKTWLPSFVKPQHHVSLFNIDCSQIPWRLFKVLFTVAEFVVKYVVSRSTACPLIFLNGFTSPGKCKQYQKWPKADKTSVLFKVPQFKTPDVLCYRLQDARGVQPDREDLQLR